RRNLCDQYYFHQHLTSFLIAFGEHADHESNVPCHRRATGQHRETSRQNGYIVVAITFSGYGKTKITTKLLSLDEAYRYVKLTSVAYGCMHVVTHLKSQSSVLRRIRPITLSF